ncbi:unnamed protein product, partial [Gulo gulo]
MTSAGILAREDREMGSMRSRIPKTVQGAHRVATFGVLERTPSGPTHLEARPTGRPPRQGQGPDSGGEGEGTLFPRHRQSPAAPHLLRGH